MKKFLTLIFIIQYSYLGFSQQHIVDNYFMYDSLNSLVDEEIIIRYAKDFDAPKYITLKSVFTDKTGKISVDVRSGMYKYYWKRYGITEYVWMWGIPKTFKEQTSLNEKTIKFVEWNKRTYLPLKSEVFGENENIYLDELVNFLKRKDKTKIQLVSHYQGMDSEKSNLNQSSLLSNKIKNYLVLNGITKDRISTRGNGSLDKEALGKRKFVVELIELNELSK